MTFNQFNAQLAQYRLEEIKNSYDKYISFTDNIKSYLPYLKIKGHSEKQTPYQGYNLYDMAAITGCAGWDKEYDISSLYGTAYSYGTGYGVELNPHMALWRYGTIWTGATIPIKLAGTYYVTYQVYLNADQSSTSMKTAFVNEKNTDLPTWYTSTITKGSWQKVQVAISVPEDWIGDIVYLSLQPTGTSTQQTDYKVYVREVMITYENNTTVYEPFVRDMSQYQKLEYIQSSGTQTINTGIYATSNLIMEADVMPLENTGNVILGYYNGESDCYRLFNYGGVAYFDCGGNDSGGGKRLYGGSFPSGTRSKYEVGNLYIKNVNTGTTTASGTATSSFTKTSHIYLNYMNSTGTASKMRWYQCKIFDGSRSNILCNLIPCYRKSDGVTGMLDTINTIFKPVVKNTAFTKGANSTAPSLQAPKRIVNFNDGAEIQLNYNGTTLYLPWSADNSNILYYANGYNNPDYLEIDYNKGKVLYYKWNEVVEITRNNTFSLGGTNGISTDIYIDYVFPQSFARTRGMQTHGDIYPYSQEMPSMNLGGSFDGIRWIEILSTLHLSTVDEFQVWLDKQSKNNTPVRVVCALPVPNIYDLTENYGEWLLKIPTLNGSNSISVGNNTIFKETTYDKIIIKYLTHVSK